MHRTIYFMLTEFCPNRCKYCYIEGRNNKQSINIDVVENAIEKYKPHRILFFGGEPLVELDKIKYLTDKYYKKIKLEVVTSTSANYIKFIQDIYSKVDTKYFTLQVSWDGPYDNRVDIEGNSISEKVFLNIMNTRNYTDNQFDIKCVISDGNVEHLKEIHKIFLKLADRDMSGQFLLAHRPMEELNTFFMDNLRKNLYDIFTLEHPYTMHLNMLESYLVKDKTFKSCDATQYKVIDINGRESWCTALSQYREKDFKDYELQARCNNDDCKKCNLVYLCDGGCRYERYVLYKDKWKETHNVNTCEVAKIWYETCDKIWKTFNKDELLSLLDRYSEFKKQYFREEI